MLQGALLAPDAGILLDQGTQVLGSLHAARVEIGAGVTFRHHRSLEPLKIDPVCVRALEEALKTPFGGQYSSGEIEIARRGFVSTPRG